LNPEVISEEPLQVMTITFCEIHKELLTEYVEIVGEGTSVHEAVAE